MTRRRLPRSGPVVRTSRQRSMQNLCGPDGWSPGLQRIEYDLVLLQRAQLTVAGRGLLQRAAAADHHARIEHPGADDAGQLIPDPDGVADRESHRYFGRK